MMRMLRLKVWGLALVVLMVVGGMAGARGGDGAGEVTEVKLIVGPLVPEGLAVSASMDRERVVLGENPLVHYAVMNKGNEPFSVNMGGDYRGSRRALRFHVRATDENGKVVADPYPNQLCLGGLSWSQDVKPGETLYFSIPLMHYCRFEKEGTYTVEVSHDLGIFNRIPGNEKEKLEALRKAVTAQVKVTIVEPTKGEARKVLERMEGMKKDGGRTGEKLKEWADYSVLRLPVYLPFLLERLEKGSTGDLVEGIGSIATVEATRALIALLTDKDLEIAGKVDREILPRLPATKMELRFGSPDLAWKKQVWDVSLEEPARNKALEMVRSKGYSLYVAGKILQVTAKKEDWAEIVKAIDGAMAGKAEPRGAEANYWDASGDCQTLIAAALLCVDAGAVVPQHPVTSGEKVVYLRRLGASENIRPIGWEETVAGLMRDKHPYVRAMAVEVVPSPMPEECRKMLKGLLADADVGVVMMACERAGKEKATECRAGVLEVVKSGKGSFVIDSALRAAVALDAYPEALELMAGRLGEKGIGAKSWMFLMTMVEGASGSGGFNENTEKDFAGIGERWKAFVVAHREELRAGKKFPIGAGGITEEYAPAGASCTVNKKDWPVR